MSVTGVRGSAVLALVLLAALAVPSAHATDACVPATPDVSLGASPVVFVGTVVELENDGRWARVRVDEEWRGGPLAREVEVRGGGEPGTSGATDRVYGPLRYLFFVRPAGAAYADDRCSATTAWTEDLASLRPQTAVVHQAMTVGGVDLAPLAPIVALAVLLAIVVVAYWLVWRARRRPPDWIR